MGRRPVYQYNFFHYRGITEKKQGAGKKGGGRGEYAQKLDLESGKFLLMSLILQVKRNDTAFYLTNHGSGITIAQTKHNKKECIIWIGAEKSLAKDPTAPNHLDRGREDEEHIAGKPA